MGTTADKLQKLMQTKADIKAAINDPSLSDRFADYPVAITDGKAYIAQKITEKGVTASGSDTFQQLGDKVGEIQSGSIEVLTFNISSGDYTEISTWRDQSGNNEYTEAIWELSGPFVFKNGTYTNFTELLQVVPSSAIVFGISTNPPGIFLQRPFSLASSSRFRILFENMSPTNLQFKMFVDFSQKIS